MPVYELLLVTFLSRERGRGGGDTMVLGVINRDMEVELDMTYCLR